MKTKISALVIGLAIFATDASAATINLFYTGVVTSVMSLPPDNGRAIAYGKVAPILHLAGWIGSERQLSRSALDSVLFWVQFGSRVSTVRGLTLDRGEYNKDKAICDSPTDDGTVVGDPISVFYFFDTDLASPGNYINTGNFFFVVWHASPVGGAVFATAGFATPVFLNQICGMFCTRSSQIDTQSAQLQAFQSVSLSFSLGSGSVQTQLFSNPAIPGDITAALRWRGSVSGPATLALGSQFCG